MMPLDGSARFRYRLDVPVGRKEGSPDNLIVGICDGLTEGIPDGMNRDISVGFEEGTSKGASDVFNLGNSVGSERVCLSEILLGGHTLTSVMENECDWGEDSDPKTANTMPMDLFLSTEFSRYILRDQ
mmetsp:Transcript_8583/g.17327  ORF Transcript_8583/g.17327 Transcript_8583/m.17327 type:complete len:128 (-) Transcript_8583:411-794(-)